MLVGIVKAQPTMLIEQLAARTLERKNYDKNGILLNRQLFEAGLVTKIKGLYELEVMAKFYDLQGNVTETYTTQYRCKPELSSVLVMAVPFSKPSSGATEISSKSSTFMKLYDLEDLGDIEITLNFDSGLLQSIGSKSTIRIFDRKLNRVGDSKRLTSKILIKTYALGIRLKSLQYLAVETLTDKNLLVSQQFTEEDGSYFTITYE